MIEFGYISDPEQLTEILNAGGEVWYDPPHILYRIERNEP